jgi:CubicO group peptidase (beta-lactamase class C family)
VAIMLAAVVSAGCSGGSTTPTSNPSNSNGSTGVPAVDASLSSVAQAVLDAALPAEGPGCSAAFERAGAVVWTGVRGSADLESHAPITPETIFDIGSVAKQFTAVAVLLLVQDGKVALDDPFSKYLDGFPDWATAITVGQLMHQTSGIPDYIPLLDARHLDRHDLVTQDVVVDALRDVPDPHFAAGARWEYSNSNYVLLAEVVKSAGGQGLPELLSDRVFTPAGLAMVMDAVDPIVGRATPYERVAGVDTRIDEMWQTIGDGGVQSTASDLALWGDNFRTGAVGGSSLLAAQTADAVQAFPGKPVKYGAGLYINDSGGVGHPGDWLGFVAAFSVSPDKTEALAVLCNSWDIDPSRIGDDLGDLLYTSQ